MARSLNGSTQYLETSAFAAMAFPVTVAAWFYSTTTASIQRVVTWASSSGGNVIASIILNNSPAGSVSGQVFFGGGVIQSASGTYSANTWHHAVAVTESTAVRCYLDGNVGSDGTYTATSLSGTTFSVGRILFGGSGLQHLSGRVCHVAVWSAALNASEAAALAAGYCPLLVRPASLIAYYPLGGFHGDYDSDLVGGYNLTPSGSPTFVDQPRIIYPTGPHGVQLASGGGGASVKYWLARQQSRIIGGGI